MKTFVKVLAVVIGVPLTCIAAYMVNDLLSSQQFYATSVGLSVRECISAARAYGASADDADRQCRKLVPKP